MIGCDLVFVSSREQLPEPVAGRIAFDVTHSIDGRSFFWFVEDRDWVLREVFVDTLYILAEGRPQNYFCEIEEFKGLSDKQILRLAAKALQLNVFDRCEQYAYLSESDTVGWNPLASKGDALSLLAKASISLACITNRGVQVSIPNLGLGPILFPNESDEDSTVCRALTCIVALVALKGLKLSALDKKTVL